MLFPFMIVGIVVLIILLFIINIFIIGHFQHPDDANESYIPKFVILCGLLISELSILLLPVDVANNNGGIECNTDRNSNSCGNVNMTLFWEIMLVIVIVMLIVIVPFSIFYYEADDGSLTGEEKRSKCCSAFKYQIAIFITTLAILLSAYFTSNTTTIPVTQHSIDLADIVTYTITDTGPPGLSPYTFISTIYDKNFHIQTSSASISYSVNFPIYIIALMSWVGWWAFAFFAGFGLAAVPFDFILSYTSRPRVLTSDEIAKIQLSIQQRTQDLVDIAIMLKRGRAEFKRTATSASEQRLRWGKDRVEVNKLQQMVYLLESDIEQLAACKSIANEYNSLIPIFKLLLGIIFMFTSILWEVHIILYSLIDPPVTALLSSFFIWFDGWFPMFGTIMYGYFSLYLLFCAMKGCFKLGVRIPCIHIYPMKVNGTYINAFLFNLAIVMLCTIPLIQFCSEVFASYVRYTDLYHIFGVQIMYLKFFVIFNTKKVFIWMIFLMAPATLVYLSIQPSDRSTTTEEFKESLQRREAGVAV